MKDEPIKNYFGACPFCLNESECLNVGSTHVMVCRDHKVYWVIGANLFSSWRDESPEIWEKNRKLLESFTNVVPIRPDYDKLEQQP